MRPREGAAARTRPPRPEGRLSWRRRGGASLASSGRGLVTHEAGAAARGAVDTQMEWEQLVRKVVVLQVPGGRVHMMTPMAPRRYCPEEGWEPGVPTSSPHTLLGDHGNGGKDLKTGTQPGAPAHSVTSPWPVATG